LLPIQRTEVEVEVAEESKKKPNEELSEDFMFVMEEDPEMYAAAGFPPPVPLPTSNGNDIETKAERSFDLDFFFDIGAKRTCLFQNL
jgi:hypothetical protein